MRALTDSNLIATCCPVSVFFPNRNCPKAPLAIFLPTKYRLATKNSAGEAFDWLMAKLRNFRTANIFRQFFLAAISPFSGAADFLLTVSFSILFSYFLLSLTSTMTAIEEWFDVTDVVCSVDLSSPSSTIYMTYRSSREKRILSCFRKKVSSKRTAVEAPSSGLTFILSCVRLFLKRQLIISASNKYDDSFNCHLQDDTWSQH